MNDLRYIILTNYNGPPINSAAIITAKGRSYKAKKIESYYPNASLGFPVEPDQTLLTLQINGHIRLDASVLRGGERDTMPYTGPEQELAGLPWWLKALTVLIVIVGIACFIWGLMQGSGLAA